MMEPTIVTNWDSMPPELKYGGEVFSTRVLADKYRRMEDAMNEFVDRNKLDSRNAGTVKKFREILGRKEGA